MPRFNAPDGSVESVKTTNRAGGEAFTESPKLKLATILLTSFANDQFYRTGNEAITELQSAIKGVPAEFVARCALFARNEFGMRSITHVVAGEIAHNVKGAQWTRQFFGSVVRRPDDMTEIVAYYLNNYKKPLPNSLKDGLASAFNKFDSYTLAKYRGEGKSVSLVDLINLVRPKPTEHNREALAGLINGTLRSTETWEAKLTQSGQHAETEEGKLELQKEAWTELIAGKKLGHFAMLRNLRNILQQAPEMIEEACTQLTNPEVIKKSLVMPFRYYAAVKEIESSGLAKAQQVIDALNIALEISTDNVPDFSGKTLIVVDGSGSMTTGMTRGKYTVADIASLFASILFKRADCDLMLFDNDARYYSPQKFDSVLTLAQRIKSQMTGGGTNFRAIFPKVNKSYERVIILSDMQGWMGFNAPQKEFEAYKLRMNVKPKLFSWDLQGYGTLMFPEPAIFGLAGFSEKCFEIIALLEQDRQALVKRIEMVPLGATTPSP